MTSARKLAANRANARNSTGPKTARGRARVAKNALRHGLSVALDGDPSAMAEVDALARSIAGPAADAETLSLVRQIAEAELDLKRVRLARHRLLAQTLTEPYHDDRAKRRVVLSIALGFLGKSETPPDPDAVTRSELKGLDKLAAILTDQSLRLPALERYEQRAFARRNSAVRTFDRAHGRSAPADGLAVATDNGLAQDPPATPGL